VRADIEEGRRLKKLPALKRGGVSKRVWRMCSPLRNILDLRGETISEFALRTGVGRKAVSAALSGRSIPKPSTVAAFASCLGLDAAGLWAAWLEWLSMEPTLDEDALRRNARACVRTCSPVHIIMDRQGVSEEDVVEGAGVCLRTVRNLTGSLDITPSLDTLVAVSAYLRADLGQLVKAVERWQSRFRGLNASEVMLAAIEHEQELRSDDRIRDARP